MLRILFTCFLAFTATFAFSQSKPEEQSVKDVIAQLFKGFETGDSAKVHACFTKEITMATAFRDKAGSPALRRESSLDGMLKAIGTPHKEVWYEEIWNMKVQIDGDFAQVWCDYAFYIDNTFSHCGIDAFHLHKSKDGWKIFHLADTRRKDNCVIPQDVQNKHK
jgi:hypothetical protein